MKESVASCPCCLQKAFTCSEPGPGQAGPGPKAGDQGSNRSPGARPGPFPGAFSRPKPRLWLGECSPSPLTTPGHMYRVISGPQPPWGSGPGGRGARNWPRLRETRRPLRPVLPTAKMPRSSILKGVPPLRMEEQGGGPQEMAFVRGTARRFQAKMQGHAGTGQAPNKKPPSGQRAQPWRYQARFTGSLGLCPRNWTPASQRTPCFPVDHTSQQVSHPRRGKMPRKK